MSKRIDLTGQRFGRLVVVSRNEEVSKQKKCSYWNCICVCGNEKVVSGKNLRNGHAQSCGCLRKELSSNRIREVVKQQWQDEEYRQMKISRTREQMKELWNDEEFRQMQSNRMKERWQDEEYRQAKSDKMKEMWQDEEYRQMKTDKARERFEKLWQDEEFRQMMSEYGKQRIHENSANWKGGITSIKKHLGMLNKEWSDKAKHEVNYTCQLTGKHGGVHAHHLYAFSSIVQDAHNTYNIEVKPQVKDYTEEELKLLEDYVAEWHKDSSNAVVLSEEAHTLFHQEYGYGGNTPEQYEEFKQRYMNGEFKDLI